MKPHSTCSKAVFATISRVPDRSVYSSVGPRRRRWCSRNVPVGSSLSPGKGQTRPQATGVTEYRCTLGVDVQPTGLKPRSTQRIWDSLCPRTRKLQPNTFGASVGTDLSREYSFQNRHAPLYLSFITPCEAQHQRRLLLVLADI